MKSKTLTQAVAVLMGVLCTVPAYSAPSKKDLLINCKVYMVNGADDEFYLKSTATKTQSGGVYLTVRESEASRFAFMRRDTFPHDTAGTGYYIVPRGNCVGFATDARVKIGNSVDVTKCDWNARPTWRVDDNPHPIVNGGFSMRMNSNTANYMTAGTLAHNTTITISTYYGETSNRQRFFVKDCMQSDGWNVSVRPYMGK
jgi:hypothetical protein